MNKRVVLAGMIAVSACLLWRSSASAQGPQSFTCVDVTEIPQPQCEALVALYDSTNGAGWANNRDWLSTNTPCSWYGVSCSGGSVTELNLFNNLLSGTLPPELGDLGGLKVLRLYDNQLTGSLPVELGNLVNLTGLFLQRNQLYGGIPSELGQLVNLTQLSLHTNALSGSIPGSFGQLAALQSLYLYGNQLSGLIPPELGALTTLRDLYLNDNQLTGSLPSELGNLASLRNLFLSNNPLSGGLPEVLGNLSQLSALQLNNTQVGGLVPSTLGNLSNLTTLRLNSTFLNGALPTSLTGLLLTSFYFDNTDLCEPPDAVFQAWLDGIASKGRTNELCRLVLSKTGAPGYGQIGSTLVYTLTLRNVTTDTVYSNVVLTDTLPSDVTLVSADPLMDYRVGSVLAWGAVTPLSLGVGASYEVVLQVTLPNTPTQVQNDAESEDTASAASRDHARFATQIFDFCGSVTQIPRAECQALSAFYAATGGAGWTNNSGWLSTSQPCSWFGVTCAFGRVTQLNLANNGLNGSLPGELGDLLQLRRLDLADNALTGGLPLALGNLLRLESLELSSNQFSGAIPAEFGGLLALQTLDLSSNQLDSPIPGELGGLPALTVLDLHQNALTGSIPGALANLASLQTLDLSSNHLDGAIPGELGGLPALTVLDLHQNALTGSIPGALGNLASLQTLDLSSNQLGEVIPAELGSLSAMVTLKLAANQLSGAMPAELSAMGALTWLDVSANQLTGSLPPSVGLLANLQAFLVQGNRIGGTPPAQLGSLALLQKLDLSDNLFSGALPDGLSNLTNLADLRFFATDLCEPGNNAFQTWLSGVANVASTDILCRLSLAKDGAPANGGTSASMAYTLSVRNLSTDTIYSAVVLTDTLPVSVTLLSASVPTYTQDANVLRWNLPAPLAPNDTFTVTISVQMPISPTTVENTASVVGAGSVLAKVSAQPAASEQDVAHFRSRVFQRAASPVVSISRSNNDAALSWNAPTVPVFYYEVWRAVNNPFFAPGAACSASSDCTVSTATSITLAGDIGDPDHNYTYLVFAVNLGGRSDPSNRVAEFDFSLSPGLARH